MDQGFNGLSMSDSLGRIMLHKDHRFVQLYRIGLEDDMLFDSFIKRSIQAIDPTWPKQDGRIVTL